MGRGGGEGGGAGTFGNLGIGVDLFSRLGGIVVLCEGGEGGYPPPTVGTFAIHFNTRSISSLI